jgi:NAD(P)-dependent dehydrogenase (short-subunit alcohol dehydrogenase family)
VITKRKTIIVTGVSQGIGAAVANLFLDRGYNVLGNSRKINYRNELQRSDRLALVEGDIGRIMTSIVDHPLADFTASVPIITKGSINAISQSLAMEYAPQDIRVNVVAPGVRVISTGSS